MLDVKTPEEVLTLIQNEFAPLTDREELVPLDRALGRVLAADVAAGEYVPDFHRSTMDGYAVRAADTFGCTDAIPAILTQVGKIAMGEDAAMVLGSGQCAAIPTGGAVPEGADAVVMVEYTEDYGDGTVGISKTVAPGSNMIFRGDDVHPGKVILRKGRVLGSQDIGALAAIGCVQVPVEMPLTVGVLSTGDELVGADKAPGPGQMRDVNSPMLAAMLQAFGVRVIPYGIVPDREELLRGTVENALCECDAVLLSGGSSVGEKDAACKVLGELGQLLLHGIAIKPGKPTILAKAGEKPLVGLPGHPVAAWFITKLFVLPLLARLTGRQEAHYTVTAKVTENISANHGRAQYHCCKLEYRDDGLWAHPIRGKSGLITTLAGADGYFCISRDCEGLPKGAEVQVTVS